MLKSLFSTLWMSLAFVIALIFSAAHVEAEISQPPLQRSGTSPWSTVCIDRLLIDLPPPPEIASANVEFEGIYHLRGIDDIGAKGVQWDGVKITETVPTDSKGLKVVEGRANGLLAEANVDFKNGLADAESSIAGWERRMNQGTPEERASIADMLAKEVTLRDEARRSILVSGRAKLNGVADEFAFRRSGIFLSGYLDPLDTRVRIFQGEITAPNIDNPTAAAADLHRLRKVYRARKPEDIPAGQGFCTPWGMFAEPGRPATTSRTELPIRSLKFPNLLFVLTVEPANPYHSGSIQKAPGMNAGKAKLDSVGVKRVYGPYATNILGSPGRIIGHGYSEKVCANGGCRPADQAYDFEAETYGVIGDPSRPHVILNMRAALSDDYKGRLKSAPENEGANTLRRASLRGHLPPSLEEGRKIFEQVLQSIRVRPGAITDGRTAEVPKATNVLATGVAR